MKFNILCLMLVTFSCHADIYQCLNQNNQIEFRDKPCDASSLQQNVINNDAKPYVEQVKLEKTTSRAERKKIQMMEKEERKVMRLKKREEKLALKETQKKEKQIKKQKKLCEKIEKIENQLRLGTKLKNFRQLSSELEKVRRNLSDHPKKQDPHNTSCVAEPCQNQS